MSAPAAAPIHLVVYAKHLERLATFYRRVLGLATIDAAADFTLLGHDAYQLSIVAMPAGLADRVVIDEPPAPREQTPIKLSFAVASLAASRQTVVDAGGSLKPAEAAWSWRGQWHLDGVDPEGNVFQLRQVGDA